MRKWTLIGLIRAEHGDSLEINECIRMFQSIFRLEIPADVSIVVWLTMDASSLHRIDPSFQLPRNAPAGLNITRFYAIENLASPTPANKCGLVRIGQGEDNYPVRDPRYVQEFFTQVVLKPAYAGAKNLLVTWGHGTPYGMFWSGEVPLPGEKYNMLEAGELAGAIKAAFGAAGGPRIDLLVTVNCFLQFFDSLFALAQAGVGYMVAAPNGNNFVGYNYTEILSQLFGDLSIEPEKLAKIALSTIDDPGGNRTTRMQQLHDVALYADDLGFAAEMGTLIDSLGQALLAELPANSGIVGTALSHSNTMNGYYFNVDFFQFVENLAAPAPAGFGPAWQKDLLDAIRSKKADLQIASYVGKSIRNTGSFPLGFTVCLPPREAQSLQYYELYFRPDSPYASPFAGGSWARMVKSFVYPT